MVSLGSGSVSTALLSAGIGAGWARDPLLALAISYPLPILSLSAMLYLTPGVLPALSRNRPLRVRVAMPAGRFPEAGL